MILQKTAVLLVKLHINLQNNSIMKKLLMIIALVSIGFFVACSDNSEGGNKFGADPESGWVQFVDSNNAEFLYSPTAVYTIPVKLCAPVNVSGLDVTYTITDIVGSSAGVFDYNSIVRFNANSIANANVELKVISNLTQNIEFDVTLTATSRANVKVGLGVNEKPIVKRVKICTTNIATSYSGSSIVVGGTTPAYTWVPGPVLTPVVGEVNKFQLPTCWGDAFVPSLTGNPAQAIFKYPGYLTVNADNTVTIVGINAPTSPNRYPGGTGTFDPCTKIIKYRLNQGLFSNPFQVDVVLTPN